MSYCMEDQQELVRNGQIKPVLAIVVSLFKRFRTLYELLPQSKLRKTKIERGLIMILLKHF